MSRIFLSHSSRNNREAIALKQWLAAQDRTFASEIFLDVDPGTGIPTGAKWREALEEASERCEAVIFLLSEHWAASDECRLEYDAAVRLHKRILCARLEPSAADELTAQFQRCDLFGAGEHTGVAVAGVGVGESEPVLFADDGLYRLLKAVRGAGIGTESFHWPPEGDEDRAPYRGWEPLTEADAAVFFGRDAEIVLGLDALRGMRTAPESLFVVLGPSGAGKSSFLRAGLLPRLKREDRGFTVLDIVRPERAVLTGKSGFVAAIHGTRARLGLTAPGVDEIATACASDTGRVAELLTECRAVAARRILDRESAEAPPTLVLPIDQAEELFTADAGPEAARFLELVAALADHRSGIELVVAATIRTDRYEAMQVAPQLADLKTVLFDNLKPLQPNHFKDVIEGPAERATEAGHRLTVEPALVAQLLEDSTGGADTLPILSLTLSSLFVRHGASGQLTKAQYLAMGGMHGVVQNVVDEALSPDPQRRRYELEQLRAAFIPWLATINPDNDQPMRRIARYVDLPEPSRPLIDRLVAKRLMVSDRQSDGELTVEVALESLLRQWEDLAAWLRDQRHNLKAADDLERAAAGWRAARNDGAWLLAGARLADAEALANTPSFRQRLGMAHEFLWASRESENQRQWLEQQRQQAEVNAAREKQATAEAHASTLHRRQQVLRRVLVATALVAVVAVVGAVVAVVSYNRAETARTDAEARFRNAVSVRLANEGVSMVNETRPGGDERGMQQIMAALPLAEKPDLGSLYTAVAQRRSLLKIINGGEKLNGAAFSPTDDVVAVGGVGHVVFWDANSGREVARTPSFGEERVWAVEFTPDGEDVVYGSMDGVIRVYERSSQSVVRELEVTDADPVTSVAVSPTGQIAATTYAGAIDVWNTASDVAAWTLPAAHDGRPVNDVDFSSDGTRLASAGADNALRQWDSRSGTAIGGPLQGHEEQVLTVSYSPDDTVLASGSADATARLWNPADGSEVKKLDEHGDGVFSVAFSPDGGRLATGGGDRLVYLYDARTGVPTPHLFGGLEGVAVGLAFSHDGDRLLSTSSDDVVRLWDTNSWLPVLGQTEQIVSMAYSPDGRYLASASHDHTVLIRDAATGVPLGTPIELPGLALAVAFSPDSRRLATAGIDGNVQMWDTESHDPVAPSIPASPLPIRTVAFSPDGKTLVTGGIDRVIRRWNANTGARIGEPMREHLGDVTSLAFSPDGTLLASSSVDNTVALWDASTGDHIRTLDGHENKVWTVAFTPDGSMLASVSGDTTVRFWDPDSGEELAKLTAGHQASVLGLAFSPDGKLMATGGSDNSARLWDVETKTPIGDPLLVAGAAITVAFAPGSDEFAVGNGLGTVQMFPAQFSPADLCDKLTQNMSRTHWREWVSDRIDYAKTCPGLDIAE